MMDFTHYIGIDWSGAKGNRHKGLAVAVADTGGNISIIAPPMGEKYWSRFELAAVIRDGFGLAQSDKILIGIDGAFGLPHADKNSYLPGMDAITAPDIWPHFDAICPLDPDFYAGGVVETYRDYVHLPFIGKGKQYERRLRVSEDICIQGGIGPCESVYHLIGPSQVGMSAFSIMRMLAWLKEEMAGDLSVWPFDPHLGAVTMVEIYAALFAKLGGHKGKIRTRAQLDDVLKALDASFNGDLDMKNDHQSDAIITAAGLRFIVRDKKYWQPAKMSAKIAATEGWIFGVA